MNQSTTQKTILIVEPDKEYRELIVPTLKELTQMIIITAKDGTEASGKIRRQKFDLILTEYDVPKLDGVEIIKAARDTKDNLLTPIIMLSTEIEKPKLYTREVKNLEFLKKPVDVEFLSSKIEFWSNKDLTRKEFKLDVDFINPFIDSAIETLQTMCKASNLVPSTPYLLEKDKKLDIDISGTLAISSPYFKGVISISFADTVYQKLVTTILKGKEEKSSKVDNKDAAAEMINIVFGKTKADLNSKGYKLERAIPKVMRGAGHNILGASKLPVLLLPFNSNEGEFFIQICVQAT